MCGRYASTTSDKDIAAAFGVGEIDGDELLPSWGVVPTQQAQGVLERAPRASRMRHPSYSYARRCEGSSRVDQGSQTGPTD